MNSRLQDYIWWYKKQAPKYGYFRSLFDCYFNSSILQEMETTRSRMIFERETIVIKDKEFYCDGGDDFGHPRVYYTMVNGEAVCNYCNRLYVLEGYEKD